LEFVSFTQKLVSLGEKVLVLLAETVPIAFDPGAIRLSQLSQQVADELALGGKLAAEIAYFVFGIERPLPPRRFLLGRSLLDPAFGVSLGPRLRISDDRVGYVVLICERPRYPGELSNAHAREGSPGSTKRFHGLPHRRHFGGGGVLAGVDRPLGSGPPGAVLGSRCARHYAMPA
jgi:hypothetical protein